MIFIREYVAKGPIYFSEIPFLHETISLDGNCEFAMWIWMFLIEADEQLMYASTGITRSRGVPKVYQRLLMLGKRMTESVKDRNLAI